jgi:hypothetical protein
MFAPGNIRGAPVRESRTKRPGACLEIQVFAGERTRRAAKKNNARGKFTGGLAMGRPFAAGEAPTAARQGRALPIFHTCAYGIRGT